jgi:hypothetical protein
LAWDLGVLIVAKMSGGGIRFTTPLEDIPEDTPSHIETMLKYLQDPIFLQRKDLFQGYEKDRNVLMKVTESLNLGISKKMRKKEKKKKKKKKKKAKSKSFEPRPLLGQNGDGKWHPKARWGRDLVVGSGTAAAAFKISNRAAHRFQHV